MIKIIRTDSDNKDFIALVKELDAYLAKIDGDEHAFYAQFNKIDKIKYAVVAYENEKAIACGAMKEYSPDAVEIKRMYVMPLRRGKGIATEILSALESWATELSFAKCILETGKKQTQAVAFYKKHGYNLIQSYGQYLNVENSICFEKILN